MSDVRLRSGIGRRGVLAAVMVVAVSVFAVLASLVVPADPASAETPAERCARETAAYNSAWAQTWAASNGRPASEAPPPPVPYVCHDPGPTTTTTSQPPVVTAPTVPSDTNVPEGPGPNMGAHAPTDIPPPGSTPIVPVPTGAPERTEGAEPGGGPIPFVEPTEVRKKPRTTTQRPLPNPDPGQFDGDKPSCSKGYGFDDYNTNTLCREGAEKLSSYWISERYRPTCSQGTRPSGFWSDQVSRRIMLNFEAGTTTERDLESIAADAINNANEASAADCHNGRNLSVKECGAGRTEVENGPPDCEGLVAVCPMPGETTEESNQRLRYIALADNEVRRQDEGFLVKIRQTKPNQDAARRGRDAERRAHPERYPGGLYVGHAPDSIWGPTPNSSEYIPMTGRINSSISGQGNTYPFYYKATGFRAGQRDGSGRCVLPVIGNPS